MSNTGTAPLTTSGLTVPTGFTITEGLSASIAGGDFDDFTVRLDADSSGTKSGQISFTNNDTNESPMNFAITGIAVVSQTLSVGSTNLNASFLEAITLTASFTGGSVTPTGNVQFYDGATLLGPAVINGSSQASMTFAFLQPGSHSITAQYAGDANVGALTSSAITQTIGAPAQAGNMIARYRLYSAVTQEHLYTTDANEYAVLATYGWAQEGNSHRVFDAPASVSGIDTVPLFRLYNTSNLQHLWTTDANEYNTLRLFPNWNAEGVDRYVFSQTVTGAIPLYRLNYPYSGLNYHHWTADANEYNVLPGLQGWVQEGIAAYVVGLPPANDNFANAALISGLPVTTTGSNAFATFEVGERNILGNGGQATIWFKWIAPSSGLATIDTAGSDFDTLLGIYTGTAVDSLSIVGENDDVGVGILTSAVAVTVTSGTTYYIAIDGYQSNKGNISLHIN